MTDTRETYENLWDTIASWSRATFGLDYERGPVGPLEHLRKECREARTAWEAYCIFDDPDHTYRARLEMELADCLILLCDAARRAGLSPGTLIASAFAKMRVNRLRTYHRPVGDEISEHDRSQEDPE